MLLKDLAAVNDEKTAAHLDPKRVDMIDARRLFESLSDVLTPFTKIAE